MLPTHRKPTPPGEILLKEFLIPMKITQAEFVLQLGGSLTQSILNSIIQGKHPITKKIALNLAAVLGTSPEFWMEL